MSTDAAGTGGRARVLATLRRVVGPVLILGLFLGAVWVLSTELQSLDRAALRTSVLATPLRSLVASVALVVLSLVCQGSYDVLALQAVGCPRPWRTVAPTGIAAQVIGQNFGAAAFTGGAVRARVWSSLGVAPASIVAAAVMVTATQWLGLATAVAIVVPFALPPAPAGSFRFLVVLLWVPGVLWLLLAHVGRGVTFRGRHLAPPPLSVAAAQLAVGALDWLAVGLAFAVLLPVGWSTVPKVVVGFWEAQAAGAASHVPGGIGVFEAALVVALPGLSSANLLSATVVYRVLYYLLPLAIVLGVSASRLRFRVPIAIPSLGAGLVFVLGALLLVSSILPAEASYLGWMQRWVGLPWIEVAHTGSAVLGLVLVGLTRPLRSRSWLAHRLAIALLLVGGIAALLRGLDWVEGGLALLVAGFLLSVRHRFDQPTALRAPTPLDLVLTSTTVVAAAWTTWTVYGSRHASDLLAFTWTGDAPRALRATTAVALGLLVLGVASVLRSRPQPPGLPTPEELARAKAVAETSPWADGWLALPGDKALSFEGEDAFLMVGAQGRSRIVMAGPVGREQAFPQLVRAFTANAIADDLRPVAYEVPARDLELWIAEGYQALKVGEYASVRLATFDLAQPPWKKLRQGVAEAERAGAAFRVLDAPVGADMLRRLREISDAWLGGEDEKGFSSGWFDESYLQKCPIAVVEVEGEVVGFANLWTGAPGGAMTIDLMRHAAAPNGAMDFLLAKLFGVAKEQGFAWFDLGMAPLSGRDDVATPTLWKRLDHLIDEHGQRFYDFEGLRSDTEKFNPAWESRYLMVRNRWDFAVALADIALLIRRRGAAR